jgi:hypothetical protein
MPISSRSGVEDKIQDGVAQLLALHAMGVGKLGIVCAFGER